MRYVGLMSGTSADAVDAVLVDIGADNRAQLLASHSHPFPPDLQAAVHDVSHAGTVHLDRLGELDTALAEVFADAALALLRQTRQDASAVRAIGSHGQTVRHRPLARHPFTLQLGNPSLVAERTGITTVADFRRRDMAAGGHGAPLVPAFHAVQFRSAVHSRAILNLGGIANVTFLPARNDQPVTGFDTGPANTLLDQWSRRHRGEHHDAGGEWAASGRVHAELLSRLLADDYFLQQPPKSTGREYFHLGWLVESLQALGKPLTPEDVQATLLELSARSAAEALRRFLPSVDEVYLCGGGCHNPKLVEALRRQLGPIRVADTTALGIPPDWVEAVAFAWLAHRTLEGEPGNLPAVTGARRPCILGGIYPAA
jgi:anhydro-N-acetylmuramic acid kinase